MGRGTTTTELAKKIRYGLLSGRVFSGIYQKLLEVPESARGEWMQSHQHETMLQVREKLAPPRSMLGNHKNVHKMWEKRTQNQDV